MKQRGSLELIGKSWRLRYRKAPAPGEPRRKMSMMLGTLRELPTKSAARRAADLFLEREDPRRFHAGSVVKWGTWCDVYASRHLVLLSRGSRTVRKSILDRHLRTAETLRDRNVHEIDEAAVQEFVAAQRRAGASPSTVRARFALLRNMLRVAEAEGLTTNPPRSDRIKLPRDEIVHAPLRARAFSPDEVRAILAAAEDPLRMACALSRGLALRASEVVGLAWSCIDLETGRVEIRQQAHGGELRPLKARSSLALLMAPPVLLADLRRYRETWQPNPAGLLFSNRHGLPLDAVILRRQLHRVIKRLGLRRLGFHGFRHAAAIAMAEAAVSPEALRRAMRHSNLTTTAQYLRATPEDVAAALAVAAIVPKEPPLEAVLAGDSPTNPSSVGDR